MAVNEPSELRYDALLAEIDRLSTALDEIVASGKDANGELTGVQLAQAKGSLQALKGARISLECIEFFAPYGKS